MTHSSQQFSLSLLIALSHFFGRYGSYQHSGVATAVQVDMKTLGSDEELWQFAAEHSER